MNKLPHDFGSLEHGHDERPGPIETLVTKWTHADSHGMHRLSPGMLARKIDQALTETAIAIRQLPEADSEEALLERINLDRLAKVVIVTSLGGISDLDEVVQLCEALSPFGCEHYADNAFNFRNCAVPYKPGDPNYQDPDA